MKSDGSYYHAKRVLHPSFVATLALTVTLVLAPGIAARSCRSSRDCPDGTRCSGGVCAVAGNVFSTDDACSSDPECQPTAENQLSAWDGQFRCVGGKCSAACSAAHPGIDVCTAPSYCDAGRNRCIPLCPLGCGGGHGRFGRCNTQARQCHCSPGWAAPRCEEPCGVGGLVALSHRACDDGNLDSGDGCSPSCEIESGWHCNSTTLPSQCCPAHQQKNKCGECVPHSLADRCIACRDEHDGQCACEHPHSGHKCELCLPGYAMDQYRHCRPVHGDGVVTRDEQCDDGNRASGDGCSSEGEVEVGFHCVAAPCTKVCHLGRSGANCVPTCDAVHSCSGHGECDKATGACLCHAHWFGERCDASCTRENTCNNHGHCADLTGLCICDAGWAGTTCSTPASFGTGSGTGSGSTLEQPGDGQCHISEPTGNQLNTAIRACTNPRIVLYTPYAPTPQLPDPTPFSPALVPAQVSSIAPAHPTERAFVPGGLEIGTLATPHTAPSLSLSRLHLSPLASHCDTTRPLLRIVTRARNVDIKNNVVAYGAHTCKATVPLIEVVTLDPEARVSVDGLRVGPGYSAMAPALSVRGATRASGFVSVTHSRWTGLTGTALRVVEYETVDVRSNSVQGTAVTPGEGSLALAHVGGNAVVSDNLLTLEHRPEVLHTSAVAISLESTRTQFVTQNRNNVNYTQAIAVLARHPSSTLAPLARDDLRQLSLMNTGAHGLVHDVVLGAVPALPLQFCDDGCPEQTVPSTSSSSSPSPSSSTEDTPSTPTPLPSPSAQAEGQTGETQTSPLPSCKFLKNPCLLVCPPRKN